MKKWLKQSLLTGMALLLILSTIPLNAFAMISLEPSSVDTTTPISVSPSLQGQSTWYYDGVTRIMNDTTGDQIGDAYRYRDSYGNTVTMINPGSLGNWVDAFGGNRNDVIAMYSNGAIQSYRMSPPSPKVAFDRLKIDDVISASSANYRYANGMIYVTVPEGNPKITKFKIREVPEKACYYINDTLNIDIEVQEFLASSSTIKSVEVYQEPTGYAPSTLKSWSNVTTDSSGKATLSVPFKVTSKEKVKFYIRATDSLSRFDQDTNNLQRTVGSVSPVGLSIELCGEYKAFTDEGTIPFYQHQYVLSDPSLIFGQDFYRVDDTSPTGEYVLGNYRYPTIYNGNWNSESLRSSLNTSFTVKYPFIKNGGIDRTFIKSAYQPHGFYHMINMAGDTARNIIDIDRVSTDDWKTVYNGNPEYMDSNMPIHDITNKKTNQSYGNGYYYIGEIAEFSGGKADNVADRGETYNGINPTHLRFVRTSWPDIRWFRINETSTSIGSPISFNFNGFEYVSLNRTRVDATITIKKDGQTVGSPLKATLQSNKANKNADKPEEEEAGYFTAPNFTRTFTPTQEGTYTAELLIEDAVKRYATKTVTFTVGAGGGTPTPGGSCSREFVSTGNGSTVAGTLTSASPSGSISSDNGVYNVVQGIPSSENLRADASSEEYLHDFNFTQKNGNVVFNNIAAEKTFTLTWTEETTSTGPDGKPVTVKTPKTETQVVKETVSGITRPYSYWEVMKYNIWQLTDSQFTNYALPGGSLTIPSGVSVSANATHSAVVEDHVFPAECPSVVLPAQTIAGGTTKPPVPTITAEAKSFAESKIGQNQVQNDSATFKGATIMSNSRTSVNGPTPSSISSPSRVSMSRTGLQIEPTKTNYWQSPSTGMTNYSVVFSLDKSASNKSFSFAVNNVTVHTPTVIYATSSDDKEHDQRTNPPARSTPTNSDTERHAYVLDRPFTVSLPTTGQHRNIPGYGQRDYSKYIKGKQVKFPFDVYSETKQVFYPANTWINVPVNIETVNFFMPVWVPEGEYTVEFRSLAINALSSGDFGGSEPEANVTIPNGNVEGHQSAAHVATDTIKVDVIGRLYDFQVTDITDYNWQSVFRESDGVTPTGNSYWVGLNGIDGDPRGNTSLFTLPIRQGSHSEGYKNVATKTGYTFKFDLKTKGDMFSSTDGIRIKPTFYFVNKDGTNRQEVDLYYHNEEDYFVKIGSEDDKVYREVQLNQTLRNVPESELIANADYYYRHASNYGLEDTVDDYYATSFSRQYIKRISKEDVITGPYSWQILNWNLRTFIGPEENEVPSNTMVPAEDIVAKEQTWYGEYSLPANVYVTAKNTSISDTALLGSLNENHLSFLRDGYIIVNFDIETIQEGDLNNPYLQYINGGLMNQWSDMEGYQHSFVDPYGYTFNLLDGDVIFYHGDQNSEMDFNSSVTH